MKTKNEYWIYLEELRRSGEINMYGAVPYIVYKFGVSREEARSILNDWMVNYDPDDYEDDE